MKKLSLVYLSIICLSIFLSSCATEESQSVDQTRIFTNYELFYNKNSNKTKALVRFTFGNLTGTSLELTEPAKVTFNGDLLLQNAVTGAYEKEYDGLIHQGTFEYVDLDGSVFVNSTPNLDSALFFENPQIIEISKSQDTYVKWSGNAINNSETVFLSFALKLFSETTVGKDSIRVFANSIQDVNNGAHIGIMDRVKTTTPTQITNAGGLMTTKYRALNKSLNVVN